MTMDGSDAPRDRRPGTASEPPASAPPQLAALRQQVAALRETVRATRQTMQRQAGRIARLEGLLDLLCDDPEMQWLYSNRSARMDATVPLFDADRARFHLARYQFACRFVAGKSVADIACGTGYGTRHLVENGGAARTIGVDISPETVRYARRRHGASRVHFHCASARETGLPGRSLDAIVSFETLEHVDDASGLVDEWHRLLRPGGLLVCSTPNEWPLSIAPHHVREYDLQSFREAIERRFAIEAMYNQNSGTRFPYNRDQPEGIVPTTRENHHLAECFIAVARRPEGE